MRLFRCAVWQPYVVRDSPEEPGAPECLPTIPNPWGMLRPLGGKSCRVCFVWLLWLGWGKSSDKSNAAVSQLSDGSILGGLGNPWHTWNQSYVADCLFRQLLAPIWDNCYSIVSKLLLQLSLRYIARYLMILMCFTPRKEKLQDRLGFLECLFSQGPSFHAKFLVWQLQF